jgi:hypothetical protein
MSGIAAWGQKAAAPEPEYDNVAELLDSNSNSLKPLERQTIALVAHTKAIGLGGVVASATVAGARSAVRLPADTKLEFIVRASSQTVDPATIIQVYRFDVEKGQRKVDTVRGGGVLHGKITQSAAQALVAMDAAKFGASSFRISAAQPLAPGEYVIMITSANALAPPSAFCFGVDSK